MDGKTIVAIAWEIFEQEQRPLHYCELTELILKQKKLRGKTPPYTVRSCIGTSNRFKRVAKGVYCPTEWDEYPMARFGKDIAYYVLESHGSPMGYKELGEAILEERCFKGRPGCVAYNAVVNDRRFCFKEGRIGLTEWQTNR